MPLRSLRVVVVAAAVWGIAACGTDAGETAARDAPRVVSLDYCADQFVLELVDRESILALSPDATEAFSYKRDAARGLPTVLPRAEDVLALSPDVVVRSYGGGPNARAFFERAGVRVVQIGFPATLDDVRANLRRVSTELGAPARGEALIATMDAGLRAIERGAARPETLYLTPSGFTAGPGTLVDEMLGAAGLRNYQEAPGWRQLPLERLAYSVPRMTALATFGSGAAHDRARTALRHPVARSRLGPLPEARLDGATTSCGGWFLLDAVQALAKGASALR